MTTSVISKIAPKNGGAFPTHEDINGEGGYQVRADATDRDSIPSLNRKQGMWVKLLSDGLVYELGSGLTNSDWTIVTFGVVTAAVVFDSGAPENIKSLRGTDPSAIDNTKNGIVNLSSDTSTTSLGATGNFSTISGGDQNQVSGDYSVIAGGISNNLGIDHSVIGGGSSNSNTTANYSVIAGGTGNTINANPDQAITIGGGESNTIGNGSSGSGQNSTIAGGNTNTITNQGGTIGGGGTNSISNTNGTISGGSNNIVAGDNGTIGGGSGNYVVNGTSATVGGGQNNIAQADYAITSGGNGNSANGTGSTIGGGESNSAIGTHSTIGGGQGNVANNTNNTIAGGAGNTITADNGTICGGTSNTVSVDYAVITNGFDNNANGNSSIVNGIFGTSDKSGQYVHSCGNNDATSGGTSQFTRVVYYCEAASTVTSPFQEGITNSGYILANNRNYALSISVVASQAGSFSVGSTFPAFYTFYVLVSVDSSGAIVTDPTGPGPTTLTPINSLGTGAGLYSVAFSYTSGPGLFILSFTNTTGVNTVRATATIEATELQY